MPASEPPSTTLPDDVLTEVAPEGQGLDQVGSAPTVELGAPLGEGGVGVVLRGMDTALARPVAAKFLHEELRDRSSMVRRFVNEARLTAALEHPNIIPVHSLAWRADTGPFFTMKLAEGETLAEHLLNASHPLRGDELDEVVGMLVKICDALELAHDNGIAHCDLKPANILLGRYGEVYLTDWGIARSFPGEPPRTADGRRAIMGTPTTMAPEQALGGAVDGRTDVFGIGSLIYVILARRWPFEAADAQASVELASRGARPPLGTLAPSAPPALVRIVEQAMAHAPDQRHPTISALRADLDRFRRGRLDAPVQQVPRGTPLLSEGDVADCMYIVKSGRFEVTQAASGDQVLRTVGAGAILGEVAMLVGGTRTATVTAATDAEVQAITAANFEQALERIPPWLHTVIKTIGERFLKDQ